MKNDETFDQVHGLHIMLRHRRAACEPVRCYRITRRNPLLGRCQGERSVAWFARNVIQVISWVRY